MARRTLVTDDFNRADNADLGAAWDAYTGANHLQIVSNQVRGEVVSPAVLNVETISTTLPNDQWVQGTLAGLGASYNEGDLLLRMAAPNTVSGYGLAVISVGTVGLYIVKYTAGTQGGLVGPIAITYTANDVFSFEAIGPTMTAYQNGTQRAQVTDTTYTAGRAGLAIYSTTALADVLFDDFASGDFYTPPLVFHPVQA